MLLELVGVQCQFTSIVAILDHVILCAVGTHVYLFTQVPEEYFLLGLTHHLLGVCCYCFYVSHNFIV